MTIHPSLIFLGGLVIITLGAEFLLRGASTMAAMLGIRPIIIGLTVVSVGTSLPELAVGITAVSEDKGALAIGNIAGTNVLNILFILGLSAALRPLPLQMRTMRLNVIVMIITAVLLIVMSLDGRLSRLEGIIMVACSVLYILIVIRASSKETASVRKEFAEEFSPVVLVEKRGWKIWVLNIVFLLGGMALTMLGANLLVSGATSIAQAMGVSDAVIGLTIVAIGTSAPELATTIMATIKNDRDVAIGNLIGSSISNVLVILGFTCVAAADGVDVSDDILWFDLPLAAAVAIVCYPVFRSGSRVSGFEGILFVSAYLVYLFSLVYLRA
ncbi:MAG TPA: calcium/sodium antiporter [Chitinophagaceae bacterium]|nr:calcium/sodium antiporter [Chitinophagaceae bacterium]